MDITKYMSISTTDENEKMKEQHTQAQSGNFKLGETT